MEITSHAAYATVGQTPVSGFLTTEHSASSYNMPVFVVSNGTFVGGDDWSGRVIGSSECKSVSLGLDVSQFGADTSKFEKQIIAAGYVLAE